MDVSRRLQGEKLAKDKIKKYITGADFNMNNIQANNIMEVFMDNNKDNIFKNTIHKINKIGEKKLRGIKDNEEIEELGEIHIDLEKGENVIQIQNYTAEACMQLPCFLNKLFFIIINILHIKCIVIQQKKNIVHIVKKFISIQY